MNVGKSGVTDSELFSYIEVFNKITEVAFKNEEK